MTAILGGVLTFWASHPTLLAASVALLGSASYLGYRGAR